MADQKGANGARIDALITTAWSRKFTAFVHYPEELRARNIWDIFVAASGKAPDETGELHSFVQVSEEHTLALGALGINGNTEYIPLSPPSVEDLGATADPKGNVTRIGALLGGMTLTPLNELPPAAVSSINAHLGLVS